MAVTWVRRIVAFPEHPPQRPEWHCRSCRREWPCGPRKQQMVRESDGSTMAITLPMAGYLAQAYQDLPDELHGSLYQRFVGWAVRR